MAEMNDLAERYQRLSHQADSLNKAVIIMKKKSVTQSEPNAEKYPQLLVDEKTYLLAKTILQAFLRNLIAFYEAKGKTISEVDDVFETTPLKDQIRDEAKPMLTILETDQHLAENQFQFWDRVITIMGNQRKLLFQELHNG